jgi:hypothetical protein
MAGIETGVDVIEAIVQDEPVRPGYPGQRLNRLKWMM